MDKLTEFPVIFDENTIQANQLDGGDYIVEIKNFPIVIAKLASLNGLAFTEEVLRDALDYFNQFAKSDKTARYILVKHHSGNPLEDEITPYVAGYVKELRYVKPLNFAGRVWEDGGIVADFYILNTYWGKIIQNLLFKGLPIGVSIRGGMSKKTFNIQAYDPTTEPPTLIIQKCPEKVYLTGFDFVMKPAHIILWFDYKYISKLIETSKVDELKQLLNKVNVPIVKLNKQEFTALAQQAKEIYEKVCVGGICNLQNPDQTMATEFKNGNIEAINQQATATKEEKEAKEEREYNPRNVVRYTIDGKTVVFDEENPPKILIVDPEDEVSTKPWGRFSKPQMKRVVSLGGRLGTVKKRQVNKMFGLVYDGWEEDWRKLKYPVYELVPISKNDEGYNLKAVLNINGLKIATIFILGVDKARTPAERKKVARFLLKYYRQLKKLGYIDSIPQALKKLAQQAYIIHAEQIPHGLEDDDKFVEALEGQLDNVDYNTIHQLSILNGILEFISQTGGVLPPELEEKIQEIFSRYTEEEIEDKADEIIGLLESNVLKVRLAQQGEATYLDMEIEPPTSVEDVIDEVKAGVIEGLNRALFGEDIETQSLTDIIKDELLGVNQQAEGDYPPAVEGDEQNEGTPADPVETIGQIVLKYKSLNPQGLFASNVENEEQVKDLLIAYYVALAKDPHLASELLNEWIGFYLLEQLSQLQDNNVEITPDFLRDFMANIGQAIELWSAGVFQTIQNVGLENIITYDIQFDPDTNTITLAIPQPTTEEQTQPETPAEPQQQMEEQMEVEEETPAPITQQTLEQIKELLQQHFELDEDLDGVDEAELVNRINELVKDYTTLYFENLRNYAEKRLLEILHRFGITPAKLDNETRRLIDDYKALVEHEAQTTEDVDALIKDFEAKLAELLTEETTPADNNEQTSDQPEQNTEPKQQPNNDDISFLIDRLIK